MGNKSLQVEGKIHKRLILKWLHNTNAITLLFRYMLFLILLLYLLKIIKIFDLLNSKPLLSPTAGQKHSY